MRDQIIVSATTGLAGGATVIGIALLVMLGYPPEAVFALIGAIIGTAGAVVGAVWVADRTRNAELAQEVEILAADYRTLIADAKVVLKLHSMEAGPWSLESREALYDFGQKARGSRMVTDHAIARSKFLNFRQIASLESLRATLAFAESFYSDCFEAEEEPHPIDEGTWAGVANTVADEAETTLRIIRGSRITGLHLRT